MLFGPHSARVDFLGGYSWVDPMGQGDSINPEYYLPSFDMLSFDVTQPSQLVISTPPGEIDRTEVASIEGFLTDSVGRAIAGRELSLKVSDRIANNIDNRIQWIFRRLCGYCSRHATRTVVH